MTSSFSQSSRLSITALALALGCALPWVAGAAEPAASDAGESSSGTSAALLRAQVLLDRAGFSPGEIDGRAGGNTTRAVRGYQKRHDLDISGSLDAPTLKALAADSSEALIDYTITADDVAGPFAAIPADTAAKAKLPALGFTSALESLGERFHVNPALLQRLNGSANFGTAGTVIRVPNVASAAPIGKAAKVVVDKSDRTVSVLDDAGTVIAQFPASTGSTHDPLPIGKWTIKGVARNPTFHYNPKLFWDADASDAKATLPAGPNNPVGVVWVDLSKPHYGIHGTPEPSKIGKTESHGCIRLTNWSAQQLAAAVSPGTPAVLQE